MWNHRNRSRCAALRKNDAVQLIAMSEKGMNEGMIVDDMMFAERMSAVASSFYARCVRGGTRLRVGRAFIHSLTLKKRCEMRTWYSPRSLTFIECVHEAILLLRFGRDKFAHVLLFWSCEIFTMCVFTAD